MYFSRTSPHLHSVNLKFCQLILLGESQPIYTNESLRMEMSVQHLSVSFLDLEPYQIELELFAPRLVLHRTRPLDRFYLNYDHSFHQHGFRL